MKYPKKHITEFIQFSEFDCRQVNLHQGKKCNYWFIEPNTFVIKLPIGEIPTELNGHELGSLINI